MRPGGSPGIAAAVAPLPLAFSRIVILDSLLALLVTSALLAFHTAIEARVAGRPDRLYTLIAWAAIGFGVLTKGPVALAVPLMVATPYALWRRASWAVWNPLGPLLMAAIIAPWVWFMEDRLPGYLEYVAITETWQRVSSDELQRTQPWWYFLVIAGVGFFPWWPLALGRRRLDGGIDARRVFGFLWLLVPLVFFSLSRSKLPQYILPLMPAVALLLASRWAPGSSLPRRSTMVSLAGWSLLGLAMAAAGVGALDESRVPPELLNALPAPAFLMAGLCLVSVIGSTLALRRQNGPGLVAALSLPLVALPVVFLPGHFGPRRPPLGARPGEDDPDRTSGRDRGAGVAELASFGLVLPAKTGADPERRRGRTSKQLHPPNLQRVDRRRRRSPARAGRSRPDFDQCAQPTVYLVHARRPEIQRTLDRAGLEKIWTGPKLHAYFCDPQGRWIDSVEGPAVAPVQPGG